MAFLGFKNDTVKAKWLSLVQSTDGSENCYDPGLFDRKRRATVRESNTDLFVESWSGNVEVDSDTAKRMCEGCHVIDQCRAYAMVAKEPVGVWGGTTPADRGMKKRYKAERAA
jgi:WhiB family transcriptional regulator, redox-sensing transcriptional regulator